MNRNIRIATALAAGTLLAVAVPFAASAHVSLDTNTAEANSFALTDPVSTIIWTADPGSEVVAGQLQLFPVSVGPVPDTGSILLPVEQTYTDGTVVSWSETGEDAEHPAPVLFINDAPVGGHGGDTASVETASSVAASTESPDVLARVLGIGGLVVGVIGLVVGVTARRKIAA